MVQNQIKKLIGPQFFDPLKVKGKKNENEKLIGPQFFDPLKVKGSKNENEKLIGPQFLVKKWEIIKQTIDQLLPDKKNSLTRPGKSQSN